MSKLKKALLAGASYVLVTALAVGGTVAYLTDTDSDVNVMTLGNVSIEQHEQERGDGNTLQDFTQNQVIYPGADVGAKESITVNNYNLSIRTGETYVDKIVSVTNTGKSEAYVRTIFAFPEAGDFDTTTDASEQWLHWNGVSDTDTTTTNGWMWGTKGDDDNYAEWPGNSAGWDVVENVEINGKKYDIYVATNKNTLASGKSTSPSLMGFYLDARVDCDENDYTFTDNNGKVWNLGDISKLEILVLSQACQTAGFDDAWSALDTAFGDVTAENAQQWFSSIPRGTQVSDNEALATAIQNGDTEIWLNPGTYQMPTVAKGKTLTINGTKNSIIEVSPAGQGEANGQLDYNLDGSTVTFNGVTIKTNNQLYAGYARLSAIYNNCVIQNTYNLGVGTSEFYNCEFNITTEYLRVNGAYSAIFDNCTFNTNGRAILIYQDGTKNDQCVTVKDCTFNATAPAYTYNNIHVAAVSIDSLQGGTYNVKFEGNNTFNSHFAGLVQIKNPNSSNNVTIIGTTYSELTYKQQTN